MAGLGFKDFQVGEVLTSSDVDGYLMAQAVMRFADSGARGSALGTATGTAVALAEGMVSYLDDANAVEVYDGAQWLPFGRILQVVAGTDTTDRSTTSTSMTDASISVTITPASPNSTIYVIWVATLNVTDGDGTKVAWTSITDASNVALEGAEATNADFFWNGTGAGTGRSRYWTIGRVASTTTAQRTYKGRFRITNTSATTATLYNTYNTGLMIALEVL